MAWVPYKGMTLSLPTVDGVWNTVVNIYTVSSNLEAQFQDDGIRHGSLIPGWFPNAGTSWDYMYYSTQSTNISETTTWTEHQLNPRDDGCYYLGIAYDCATHVGASLNNTNYRVFMATSDTISDYDTTINAHHMLMRFQNNVFSNMVQPNVDPNLCYDITCMKDGDYYIFRGRVEYGYGMIKIHKTAFFYDNDVDTNIRTFYVTPAWRALNDSSDSGGNSTTDGGSGSHSDASDVVDMPNAPTLSAASSGLVTLFRPTLSQLQSLGNYLWTNLTDFIENIQKLFSNPMDVIISCNIFPVSPSVGTARKVKLGLWETNISMSPLTSQWYVFDCGSVFIPEYWGGALDFSPYTKITCMLPYIGSVNLNTDEIMGKNINIRYIIDMLSGSCVALISVNGSVYYQFTGECSTPIPLTGADWSRVYSAVIGAVGTAVGGVIGAGASAAVGSAIQRGQAMRAVKPSLEASKALNDAVADVKKYSRGAPELRDALNQASKAARDVAISAANVSDVSNSIRASRVISAVTSSAGQIMGGKLIVQHSGTISGSAGMLGVRRPFITIEYPNQSLAENYKHFFGYPSNIYSKMGDMKGYTEVEQIEITGFSGTDNELAELLEIVKGGVYL